MERRVIVFLVGLLLTFGTLAGCSGDDKSQIPPEVKFQETTPAYSSDDWTLLNEWLAQLYGLPPVSNTTQLRSAAMLVSNFWLGVLEQYINELEKEGIPWERTGPSVISFHYYVLHDAQLRNAQTPLEFLACDELLGRSVEDFHNTSNELILMKQLGENPRTFSSEEAAEQWFRELDPAWEEMMQDVIDGEN